MFFGSVRRFGTRQQSLTEQPVRVAQAVSASGLSEPSTQQPLDQLGRQLDPLVGAGVTPFGAVDLVAEDGPELEHPLAVAGQLTQERVDALVPYLRNAARDDRLGPRFERKACFADLEDAALDPVTDQLNRKERVALAPRHDLTRQLGLEPQHVLDERDLVDVGQGGDR